jgi:hypothetical protein
MWCCHIRPVLLALVFASVSLPVSAQFKPDDLLKGLGSIFKELKKPPQTQTKNPQNTPAYTRNSEKNMGSSRANKGMAEEVKAGHPIYKKIMTSVFCNSYYKQIALNHDAVVRASRIQGTDHFIEDPITSTNYSDVYPPDKSDACVKYENNIGRIFGKPMIFTFQNLKKLGSNQKEIQKSKQKNVPIRLTQTPTTCRVLPIA